MGSGRGNYCECSKINDLINWVHHIHFDNNDRVDHCVENDVSKEKYKVIHCGCFYYCEKHRDSLPMHAVDRKKIIINQHISFIEESFSPFTITLKHPCPNKKEYYHLDLSAEFDHPILELKRFYNWAQDPMRSLSYNIGILEAAYEGDVYTEKLAYVSKQALIVRKEIEKYTERLKNLSTYLFNVNNMHFIRSAANTMKKVINDLDEKGGRQ